MKIGVIDIGSNSVRMAWCDGTIKVGLLPEERLAYSRLAEGATASGILSDEAVERTIHAVRGLLSEARQEAVDIRRISATSALREAKNASAVKAKMEAAFEQEIKILSSEEEATYSYKGATFGLPKDQHMVVVLDVGGGSTELCWGMAPDMSASVPVGAVRLKEFANQITPLPECLAPLTAKVPKRPLLLVGVGGTITTMAAVFEQLETYRAQEIHQLSYGINAMTQFNEVMKGLPIESRMALAGMSKARADILPYGMDIVLQVMQALHTTTLTVSTTDLLLGQLLELV